MQSNSPSELGINSVADLAKEDLPDWLIIQSRVHPRLLVRAVDRALLKVQLGDLVTKLEAIPVFTASELVLYAIGDRCYKPRWQQSGLTPKFDIRKTLDDQAVAARYNELEKILGTKNIELQIGLLANDRNLIFILDNKLTYSDL